MKIVIAPTAFKESLTAAEVAACIARGFRHVFPSADIDEMPLGDGGPGTMDALVAARDGCEREVDVCGPLGETVRARYGIIDGGSTAIIEMAVAAGLELVPQDRRNPLVTSTKYGFAICGTDNANIIDSSEAGDSPPAPSCFPPANAKPTDRQTARTTILTIFIRFIYEPPKIINFHFRQLASRNKTIILHAS